MKTAYTASTGSVPPSPSAVGRSFRYNSGRLAVGSLVLVSLSLSLGAQVEVQETIQEADPDPVADAVCVMCHDDVHTPASVPNESAQARIHAAVACVDCHVDLRAFDLDEMEHTEPVLAASCTPCHDDVSAQLGDGAHGAAGVSCAACHGNHEPSSYHAADSTLVFGRVTALCTRCHAEVASASAGDLHSRAFSGRTCLACHDAHDNHQPASIAANGACMMCHSDPEAVEVVSAGAPTEVAASVHGQAGVSCVLCHTYLQGALMPHEEDREVEPVRCVSCHPAAGAAHARGVHAGTLAADVNGGPAAKCTDCHGAHDVLGKDHPRSPVFPLNLPATCESCHQPNAPPEHAGPAGEQVMVYESSIHGRLLLEKGLVVSANCVSCHGSHEIQSTNDERAATSRLHVPYTCGTCHAGMLTGYLAGVHGIDFLAGSADVPVCTDCHSEHAIEDPALTDASVSAEHVAATCASCHADDELALRYGLSRTVLSSWGSSYHGIAAGFGETRAANCASCHGFHAILPSSDPRSQVHPDNLQETCGACHLGAGAAFARVPVHSTIDRATNFVPWIVRLVYTALVVGLIGAFFLFILIDLFGRLRLRLGWGPAETEHVDPEEWPDEESLVPAGEGFVRMNRGARIQHLLLIVSFMLLVVTGLPVFLHESEMMRSLIDAEGGFHVRSLLHRAAALVLIGLSLWHIVTLFLQPEVRRWFMAIMIRPRDVTNFAQELMFNLGIGPWLARRRLLRALFERWPALRAFGEVLREDFDRHGPVEAGVVGLVDLTHAPGSDGSEDLVGA